MKLSSKRSYLYFFRLCILLAGMGSILACGSKKKELLVDGKVSAEDLGKAPCFQVLRDRFESATIDFVNLSETAADDLAATINSQVHELEGHEKVHQAALDPRNKALKAVLFERSRGGQGGGDLDQFYRMGLSFQSGKLYLNLSFSRVVKGMPESTFEQDFLVLQDAQSKTCQLKVQRTLSRQFQSQYDPNKKNYQISLVEKGWQLDPREDLTAELKFEAPRNSFISLGGVWTKEKVQMIRNGRNLFFSDIYHPLVTLEINTWNQEQYQLPLENRPLMMIKGNLTLKEPQAFPVLGLIRFSDDGKFDSQVIENTEKVTISRDAWLRLKF